MNQGGKPDGEDEAIRLYIPNLLNLGDFRHFREILSPRRGLDDLSTRIRGFHHRLLSGAPLAH